MLHSCSFEINKISIALFLKQAIVKKKSLANFLKRQAILEEGADNNQ
jgi:hypothetical protein